jgi:hypothetical protein
MKDCDTKWVSALKESQYRDEAIREDVQEPAERHRNRTYPRGAYPRTPVLKTGPATRPKAAPSRILPLPALAEHNRAREVPRGAGR